MLFVAAILSLEVAPAVSSARANTQTFDGITVIELADEDGENAIRGWSDHGAVDNGRYIVTYVSAQGSYATLTGSGSQRGCVAWAILGSYSGTAITFGLPPTNATVKSVSPKICQPFTLRHEGAGVIRVSARNLFKKWGGPLEPDAQSVSYDRQRTIVAHVPLVAFDWGAPAFQRHGIKGIPLGPLQAAQAAAGPKSEIKVSDLNRMLGRGRTFEAAFPSDRAARAYDWVKGYVVERNVTGWPWDVLYTMHYSQTWQEASTVAAFEGSIKERHGLPGAMAFAKQGPLAPYRSPAERSDKDPPGSPSMFWIYDLSGRPLGTDSAAPDNCLATAEHWISADLPSFNTDIGPWGCGLVVAAHANYSGGVIRGYRIEMMSGYTAALNHFSNRLKEIGELRKKVEGTQAYKPKL